MMKATFVLFSSISFIGAFAELVMNLRESHPIFAWCLMVVALITFGTGMMMLRSMKK